MSKFWGDVMFSVGKLVVFPSLVSRLSIEKACIYLPYLYDRMFVFHDIIHVFFTVVFCSITDRYIIIDTYLVNSVFDPAKKE